MARYGVDAGGPTVSRLYGISDCERWSLVQGARHHPKLRTIQIRRELEPTGNNYRL